MSNELAGEFAMIARHFRPLAGPGALELGDDAAVFDPPPGLRMVAAADAIVAGVHFLPDDPPDLVGRKLLRVNLSDLAAMGATPFGYLMTVSLPRATPEVWLRGFVAGLAADQREFELHLLGGDTTHTPGPTSLSLTILGTVEPGRELRRAGAEAGDNLWVSGTVGDGALGLLAARGRLADPDGILADRYRLPQPRVALGRRLAGIAHAAMDVSDGLVQDAAHLCRAGGVGAVVEAALVPASAAAGAAGPEWLATRLTGGDDYELLMAVPERATAELLRASLDTGVAVTRIGRLVAGEAVVTVIDAQGATLPMPRGWDHFGTDG